MNIKEDLTESDVFVKQSISAILNRRDGFEFLMVDKTKALETKNLTKY